MSIHFRKTRRKGQSLAEYSMVVSLIAMASVAGLTTLAGQFDAELEKYANAMNGTPGAAIASSGETMAGVSGPGGTSVSNPSGTGVSGEEAAVNGSLCLGNVCLENSMAVNEPTFTTGSLGSEVVTAYANRLQLLAEDLADAGADPAVVDLITQLALQGHKVAVAQAEMDSKSMGWLALSSETSFFSDLWQQLEINPLLLGSPVLYDIISSSVDTITASANSAAMGGIAKTAGIGGGSTTEETAEGTPEETHEAANNICKAGGDTSQCVTDTSSNGNNNGIGNGGTTNGNNNGTNNGIGNGGTNNGNNNGIGNKSGSSSNNTSINSTVQVNVN